MMTLDAGTKLGRYEILSLLGAGGMGEVYLVRGQPQLLERFHYQTGKVMGPTKSR